MKRSVSCLAAVAAVAAGSAAGVAVASAAPVASGPRWIVQSTPNRAVPSNTLVGISCTSGKFRMAVGNSGPIEVASDTSRTLALKARRPGAKPATVMALAERWDGTR